MVIQVQSDTLLLAVVFENFRNMCIKVYELQSVTKIMEKTAIRTISYFYPLPTLNNVEKQ